MLTYGFFNAVYTEGIPDRSYTADNLSEFFASIIGDGVSADIQDSFKVVAGSGMQVNLNPGFGWIHGYYAKNSSPYPLVVSAAPPTDTRIDAIVLRWSRSDRNILPQVLPGVASPNPQRPQIVRNADIYDLLLGYVTLRAGDSAITSSMITDTRADVDVCGIIDTFAARLLPDGSVTAAKIAANAVTREKLATDALYSPLKLMNASTYNVVADDTGKTVEFTYNGNISVSISNEVASALPAGAEIAFICGYNRSLSITIGSNWYLAKPGELGTKGRTLTCSDGYQLVAVKKIGSSWFTATGNFD